MLSQVVNGLLPFTVALMAWLQFNEKITFACQLAMVISFGGVLVLACGGSEDENFFGKLNYQPYSYTTGIICSLIVVFFSSLLCITTRSLQKVNFQLILMFSNLLATAVFSALIGIKFLWFGTIPFTYLKDKDTQWHIINAIIANILRQSLMYYAN